MNLLRSIVLSDAGFAHAFPERAVDDSTLRAALGVDAIVQVKQVHGTRCVEAREVGAAVTEADALVARAASQPVAIGVRVADCVPVLLADPATGNVAAMHAGWRGVVGGVLAAGVKAVSGGREGGVASFVAAIGPCIGPCCFEVGEDVAAAIARSCGEDDVVRRAVDRAKPHVDLRAAVRAALRSLGLRSDRIDVVDGCTKHETARFHSFRRDGADSGRMLAAIVTKPFG